MHTSDLMAAHRRYDRATAHLTLLLPTTNGPCCAMPKITHKSEEQKHAEAAVESFQEGRGPFVVSAETTRMAMVFTNAKEPDNPIIFANDSFLSLTGYARDEVLGQSFNFLMAHAADADALALIQAAFEGKTNGGSEILYRRKDGSEFWAALFISPVRDERGDVYQYFASFVDLTKHKDDEAQAKMLVDELNHRVKNILSTVQSIVLLALRTTSERKVIEEAIQSRLFALSRSHDLLTRENWKSAGLHDVVKDALEPFGVADEQAERIVIAGENVRLPPRTAMALGIAFNELATNAFKYGALSNRTGSVLIESKIKPTPDGDQLILHWQEKDGPPVTPPLRKGFGSRMLERGLPHELGGKVNLDYRLAGIDCSIEIPLGSRVG